MSASLIFATMLAKVDSAPAGPSFSWVNPGGAGSVATGSATMTNNNDAEVVVSFGAWDDAHFNWHGDTTFPLTIAAGATETLKATCNLGGIHSATGTAAGTYAIAGGASGNVNASADMTYEAPG